VEIDFQKSGGLVRPSSRYERTGDVLMLGFMIQSRLRRRNAPEKPVLQRSRNKLWKKGESSGHVLRVREMRVDCDADALLVRVERSGRASVMKVTGVASSESWSRTEAPRSSPSARSRRKGL